MGDGVIEPGIEKSNDGDEGEDGVGVGPLAGASLVPRQAEVLKRAPAARNAADVMRTGDKDMISPQIEMPPTVALLMRFALARRRFCLARVVSTSDLGNEIP
ncbi:hypothetical protein C5C66_03930 [Rathayibacter toxicus]|uniref:Uncharacterized protein n=1 Tax=Rathayibacter toxicus TaxID=145458 RepID=A0A0C5BRQ5_9MICO|nr:hypothetical protein TI83_04090 [Rathayibacter toxicus]ALS56762.1 hypothetical protein APU90_02380 [Rathayibacter toxicus]KKM46390.1 hypothetical protein VT73_05125 [Rathayibacter toxicus]PPG23377.1 hypothetical protein C5D15_03895 [Rathayibacter toxicus]PPG47961.1 hypothetical protein C5D16_03895 [Rathayibacter toxicus]